MAVLTVLILLHFLPPRQERYHCIKPLGIHISVTNFDVNDGVFLYVP